MGLSKNYPKDLVVLIKMTFFSLCMIQLDAIELCLKFNINIQEFQIEAPESTEQKIMAP